MAVSLSSDEGNDIAGRDLLDLRPLVGVHLEHPPDPLAVPLGRVEHHLARAGGPGIDAHEGERAVFVVDDLEGEPGEGRTRVGPDHPLLAAGLLLALVGGNLDARHVHRRGQVVHHRVEQRLHALVLEGGAAEHRAEDAADRAGLDTALQGRDGNVSLLEIFFHRRVIDRERGVEQELAVFARLLGQLRRDRRVMILGAELAALPDHRLHLDQVDDALELVLDPDRQLQRQRHDVKLFLERRRGAEEIGAGAVELVDEDDAGNVVAVGEPPVGLRLRLHPGHALDDEDRPVQHAQAAVDLDVEVDMAGGVDDVDPMAFPLAGDGGGGDGDPALALLLHVVGRGRALVHLADLVRHTRVIKDALGRGCLARVDMRGDADIADLIKRRAGHGGPPSRRANHNGRGERFPRARLLPAG